MANDQEYVELGRACGDVCQILYRKLRGRQADELNRSLLDAIGDLTACVTPTMPALVDTLTNDLNRRTMTGIQRKVIKESERNAATRFILARSSKDKIAAWKQDLVRVLHVFNVC